MTEPKSALDDVTELVTERVARGRTAAAKTVAIAALVWQGCDLDAAVDAVDKAAHEQAGAYITVTTSLDLIKRASEIAKPTDSQTVTCAACGAAVPIADTWALPGPNGSVVYLGAACWATQP